VVATVDVVSRRDGALSMGEIFTEFMQTLLPAWMEKMNNTSV
jgi:hypothetical protein